MAGYRDVRRNPSHDQAPSGGRTSIYSAPTTRLWTAPIGLYPRLRRPGAYPGWIPEKRTESVLNRATAMDSRSGGHRHRETGQAGFTRRKALAGRGIRRCWWPVPMRPGTYWGGSPSSRASSGSSRPRGIGTGSIPTGMICKQNNEKKAENRSEESF